MEGFDYATLWFWVIVAIFGIYFFLEGFDFGVDLLRPFIAKNERERKAMIGTIGPFWDGNEVWGILAATVIFATFPLWFGAMFTAMYPIFALILLALLGRGVAFEFRHQVNNPAWRVFWDFTSFVGALIPAYLWGVVMANLVRGLPISADGRYQGGVLEFFNGFALLGGLATLLLFILHGATFLLLRLDPADALHTRARRSAFGWGFAATIVTLAFVYIGYVRENLFKDFGLADWVLPTLAALTLISIWVALTLRREALSFIMSGLTIAFSAITVFVGLYPRVLPSTLGNTYDLTIRNAASQPYTLQLMLWVGLIFLPLIIGYQVWNYYVFRRRVRVDKGELDKGY